MTQLTPDQLEEVETDLVECFAHTQYEIAERLGLQPQPNGKWSASDEARIWAEVEKRRQFFIDCLLDS